MTEYFDNLLSFHHFFDITVDRPQILLLLHKVFTGQVAHLRSHKHHDTNHQQRNKCQGNIQHDHTDQCRYQRDHGVDRLRNTLADELSERIHIIRINRHDIAVCMGIKIFDRQRFHMGKQLHSESFHGSLADCYHDPVISIG